MLEQLPLLVKLRHDYSIAPWNILFCLYSLLWWLVLSDQAGTWESFWTLPHLHSQLPFKFLLSIQRALDLPPCVHSHRPIQQETEQREIKVEERKIELGSPSLSVLKIILQTSAAQFSLLFASHSSHSCLWVSDPS